WMLVGFVHGVMNTDNMALGGETIDYGPCAFIDAYDPAAVFSSIDRDGRYAFGNQPSMAHWNLARLAEALLPILHENEDRALELAKEALAVFPGRFHEFWLDGMRRKLGLFTAEADDPALIDDLLVLLLASRADYTNSFRDLTRDPLPDEPLFRHPNFQDWHEHWTARRSRQNASLEDSRRLMLASNPSVIPRNHRVEEALAAAVEHGDQSVMDRLLKVLTRPFDDSPEHTAFQNPPPPDASPYVTYCGT
ncbi:MAG: hypothetical protein EOM25_14395, partial [Deltaproteobacteria bacterium]|nr:hypothetical protein [Deltaproteobacteria bacterium]